MVVGRRKTAPCKHTDHSSQLNVTEFFPNMNEGRLRAKALNSFGYFCETSKKDKKGYSFYYRCTEDGCEARLALRKVNPNINGLSFGLSGCLRYTHALTVNENVEIVFDSYDSAQKYFDSKLESIYKITKTKNEKESTKISYRQYKCRRNSIKDGQAKCESSLSLQRAFKKSEILNDPDPIPFVISGNIHHDHGKDVRYERVQKRDKEIIDHLNSMNVPSNKIFKKFHVPINPDEVASKPITQNYVYDRKRLKNPEFHLPGENMVDGLLRWFKNDFVKKVNIQSFMEFKKEDLPEEIQQKWIETKRLFVFMTNDDLLKQFEAHPHTLLIDASHGVNNISYYKKI